MAFSAKARASGDGYWDRSKKVSAGFHPYMPPSNVVRAKGVQEAVGTVANRLGDKSDIGKQAAFSNPEARCAAASRAPIAPHSGCLRGWHLDGRGQFLPAILLGHRASQLMALW